MMEEILIRLSGLSGITGSFYVGDDGSFVVQTLTKSFSAENARRVVLVLSQTFEALSMVAQFSITKMMVNTNGARLFIRRTDKGYLNLLADPTAEVAVIEAAIEGALKEMKNIPAELLKAAPAPAAPPKPAAAPAQAAPVTPRPGSVPAPAVPATAPAPAAPPRPAPKPSEPVDPAVLDKMAAIADEFLGELSADIFQNQLADNRISKDRLVRDPVMKFCYAMQKDASMIIGPSAAKQMADKMMLLLK
jgi:predicted regulator of Ras-like GTPase activity (Roadblock/LC7/MglB family)